MTWARRLISLPPALAGAALIWQALAAQPKPPIVKAEERRIPISYVLATPRTFTPRITGYGTVAPARVWTAAAQVAGPIEYLNPAFVRGGFIAKGDVLVRIAAEDTQFALASPDADLKSAEARLDELQVSQRTTRSIDYRTAISCTPFQIQSSWHTCKSSQDAPDLKVRRAIPPGLSLISGRFSIWLQTDVVLASGW